MQEKVKNLPHILALLDDESAVVQDAVRAELLRMGDALDGALAGLSPAPTPRQMDRIRDLLQPVRRERFAECWPAWFSLGDTYEQLETAYQTAAEYLEPSSTLPRLSPMLDELAAEYRRKADAIHARSLASFLFLEQGFRGAHIDYYSPENSNLVHVIRTRRGIPLSLTCLFMLVGHRVGLAIQGCNFPGHFLARFRQGRDPMFVDCFDRGRILTEADLLAAHGEAVRESLRHEATAKVILERMLRNLVQAYRKRDREDEAVFILGVLETTREAATQPRK